MRLKWPIVSRPKIQNAFFRHVDEDNLKISPIETSNETIAIGCSTAVVYLLLYLYIYYTAYIVMRDEKISRNLITTASESFQYCEKIGTTVLIILFLGLLQGLFSKQNFYKNDNRRISIIAVNYVIVMCWILFFFIWPDKNKEYNKPHFILAFIVLILVIYNAVVITDIYTDCYNRDDLNDIYIICYIIIGAFCFCILSVIIHFVCIHFKITGILSATSSFVALCEICCLFLFGIFLIFFSILPPLLNRQDLVCYYSATPTI